MTTPSSVGGDHLGAAASDAPIVERFSAPELGNSSYLVIDPGSGEAVVIDPVRDIEQYLASSNARGVRITTAVETHVHNDFISGARELQHAVGARIGAAHDAGLECVFDPLSNGSEIVFGRRRLLVRHTPGHTPHHLSYVLVDEDGRELALFSGGALIVGSIARTDLFGAHLAARFAVEAHRTLHSRLRDLPDHIAVYPTHGGGSFCSAGAGPGGTSTMARERRTNPFLNQTELMPFIAHALHTAPYPEYYREIGRLNRAGVELTGGTLPRMPALGLVTVENLLGLGAALVDVRASREFARAHIPASYCIGVHGTFSAWAGWLLKRDRAIVLVGGDDKDVHEAHRQLFRIGFDDVVGYLQGGVEAWMASGRAFSSFETATMEDVAGWLERGDSMTIVDTRSEDEWVHGHLPGAVRVPVHEVVDNAAELSTEAPVALYCRSGYRSAIAASLLEHAGFKRIIHISSPYSDWARLELPPTIPG